LHKLVNVLKIRDLEPEETVARELALFKIAAEGHSRAEVMQICEIFRGKVIDVTKRSIVIEITGTTDKIDACDRMVRPFGLIEMMRTGEIAILRGRGETCSLPRRAAAADRCAYSPIAPAGRVSSRPRATGSRTMSSGPS